MTKYLIHIFFVVLVAFVVMTILKNQKEEKLPAFAQVDHIALNHDPKIQTTISSTISPSREQIAILEKDYASIWAHLNHLYASNEVEVGKEYYTKDFFKAISKNASRMQSILKRTDLEHHLEITEWARDGLVCIATDSNVTIEYQTAQKEKFYTKATLVVALLLQGEHWRIDAIEFLNEENIKLL